MLNISVCPEGAGAYMKTAIAKGLSYNLMLSFFVP
jgi:hypothetical protein